MTMSIRYLLTVLLGLSCWLGNAQDLTQPPFTPAAERMQAHERRQQLSASSIINNIPFTNVGPTIMSGRVVDIDVWQQDPTHFYVAYASGGLWRTTNNGNSFEPLFDHEAVMTIGDIAVDWSNNTIWVGTGEVNSSRSSYAGAGVYKSTDGGKNWTYCGLGESHHIGKILLHPTNKQVAWVAALGHLYSPNAERGIYKTSDGGKTWQQTLYVHPNAGAVDMVIDPSNPDVLYASSWERERRAWNFVESGQGSAIWKSMDGGKTWNKVSGANSGFPAGEGVGRIGLDAARTANGKTILYAAVDNNNRRPAKEGGSEGDKLTKDQLRRMSAEDFAKIPVYQLRDFLQANGFPARYTPARIKEEVAAGRVSPATLANYNEDANSQLFETAIVGLEIYRSDDQGKTWKRTHDDYLNDVYFTYGYYFGQVRATPNQPDKIYTFGVPVLRSDDGGKTWAGINGNNVHVDHHALWINPRRPGHLILGNDGGINISYDDGKTWSKCNSIPLGQFYAVAVDMATPYRIYGGLQDNGVWMGSHQYTYSNGWQQEGQYPYKELIGGDGMQIAIDPRDNETVYTGFQFGNYFRMNTRTGDRKFITPKHDLGEQPYRWNWQTPIHLSVHQPDILYMGSNKLMRSFNKGDDFQAISPDLTRGGRKGDVPFGTLTTIHESPLRFGLLYTGSDDGLVYCSRDGGYSWTNISNGLPENYWVTRVQASAHAEGTVFVSLNGYRWDNFTSMVYRSDDYGQTWQRIGLDLPQEPVNVVKEDPSRKGLLYVGTDHGLYVSLNNGSTFMGMNNGLPAVAVHDLVVQTREKHLIVGTHGRSIYLADIAELQSLSDDILTSKLHLFSIPTLSYRSNWGRRSWFADPAGAEAEIPVFTREATSVRVSIQTKEGQELRTFSVSTKPGLNYLAYDGSIASAQLEAYTGWLNKDRKPDERPKQPKAADDGKIYLMPGKYLVKIEAQGESKQTEWEIK